MDRPDWDEYFMGIAELAAQRATCLRKSIGAVLVKDTQILATGYNGAPKGIKHCKEVGCLRQKRDIPSGERHEICRGVHAEQNLIAQAAVHGVKSEGATVYCTHQPCVICAKILINAGIKYIFYKNSYEDEFTKKLLDDSHIYYSKISE